MKSLRENHERAMELADYAFAAKRRGDVAEAKTLFQQALDCERRAAEMIASDLTALSALLLSAPQPTHAANDVIDPNHIPTIKLLPDLVIAEVAPVYNLYFNVGWVREPYQIWVKVSNQGKGDSTTDTNLLLGWGTTIWPSEEQDPDTDHEAVPPIPAGGYHWVKMYTRGYSLWTRSTYYFMQVNRHREVVETDYTNNSYYSYMK